MVQGATGTAAKAAPLVTWIL